MNSLSINIGMLFIRHRFRMKNIFVFAAAPEFLSELRRRRWLEGEER